MPITFTAGYIEVWRDGVCLSRHRAEREAVEAILAHAETADDGEYEIRPATVKVNVKRRITGPDAPALGPVLTISSTELTLTLDRPATGPTRIDRYEIERSSGAGFTQIASGLNIFSSDNKYPDTGLLPSTVYFYRCRAVDTTERVSEWSLQSGTTSAGAANQVPVWDTGWSLSIAQGGSSSVASRATDPEGSALSFSRSGGTAPNGVTVSLAGLVSVDGSTAVGTYTLGLVADDGVDTASTSVSLTVGAAATADYLYSAEFDSLTTGRAISVVPGGYLSPLPKTTNPEGWLQQTVDNLGRYSATTPRTLVEPQGNFPWSAAIIPGGASSYSYTQPSSGTYTLPAVAPATRTGSGKMLRLEVRDNEFPLAGTSDERSQFRMNGHRIADEDETWVGFSVYLPTNVGASASTPWPTGVNGFIWQISSTNAEWLMWCVTNNLSPQGFGLRLRDGTGALISADGFGASSSYPIVRDDWNDFVIQLKMSRTNGICKVWINGVLRGNRTGAGVGAAPTVGTGDNSTGGQLALCLYDLVSAQNPLVYAYFDRVRIARTADGGSYDAVFPGNP